MGGIFAVAQLLAFVAQCGGVETCVNGQCMVATLEIEVENVEVELGRFSHLRVQSVGHSRSGHPTHCQAEHTQFFLPFVGLLLLLFLLTKEDVKVPII